MLTENAWLETKNWKDQTFDSLVLGEPFGPLELIVSDHMIKRFAFMVDDYGPWVLDWASSFGRPVAPAAILIPELLRLTNLTYNPNTEAAVHQREEFWLLAPVFANERVIINGSYAEKYVKREKGYVVMQGEARSATDNRLLVRHKSVEVAHVGSGIEMGAKSAPKADRWVKGEYPTDRPPVFRANRELLVGTPVAGVSKEVHQDQMSLFSSAHRFWRNIHTDLEAAHRTGFPKTIAQGMMEAMYLSEMGANFFGASWFTSGWISVSFVHPVYAGDRVVSCGVVTERKELEGEVTLELEVWMENQEGRKTVVGWMSGLVA